MVAGYVGAVGAAGLLEPPQAARVKLAAMIVNDVIVEVCENFIVFPKK
jgi:hypothetical protein